MTYEVTGRVARITFNRPDKGNAIIADTPVELAACVERADLDPNVHVILVSGAGRGILRGLRPRRLRRRQLLGRMPTGAAPCSTGAPRRSTTCPTSRGIR